MKIPSQPIKFADHIHKKHICVLLDGKAAGNYISGITAHDFNLIVKSEEGYEKLTLADKSKGTSAEIYLLSIAVWRL